MKICVFLGSRPGNNPLFGRKVGELCEEIKKRNFSIVYGGGDIGLMGLLAKTSNELKINIVGVIPEFLKEKEIHSKEISELHIVKSMAERKEKMIQLSDAFLVLPGGIGTMDEFFEVLTYKQLGLHNKPIAMLNTADYFQTFKKFMIEMIREGFYDLQSFEDIIFDSSIPHILDRIVNYYS